MLKGKYAFRFHGHPVENGKAQFLVGLGVLNLNPDSTPPEVHGAQTATMTPMSGLDAKLVSAEYELNGEYAFDDGTLRGTAKITFTSPGKQTVYGSFALVGDPSGDRAWLISTKTQKDNQHGAEINEIVTGEGFRL